MNGRCVRAAAVVLIAAVWSGSEASGQQGLIEHAASREIVVAVAEETRAESLLATGERAELSKDWAAADASYRVAWTDLRVRRRAAQALFRMHKTPGFKLPIDQASVAATGQLLGPTFRRYDTPHFVVLSECDRSWSNARGQILERARDQFYRVARRMDVPVAPHQHKLLCVLFKDRDRYRAFARAHDGVEAFWVAGYYSTVANRIVFYDEASAPGYAEATARLAEYRSQVRTLREQAEQARQDDRGDLSAELNSRADALESRVRAADEKLTQSATAGSTRKTVHECIHLLAFNTGLQRRDRDYPFWLSEGLATSFETDQTGKAFGPDRGAVSDRRELFDELAASGKLLPFDTFVSLSEVPQEAEAADGLYSQSFMLFNHLFGANPRKLGDFIQRLGDGAPGRRPADEQRRVFAEYFGDPGPIGDAVGIKPR